MADEKMKAGDDPADFTVDQVNAYLATADDDEKTRVLAAEQEGEARKGILEGSAAKDDDTPADDTADATPEDSGVIRDPDAQSDPDAAPKDETPTGQGTVNQEGAPADLVAAADEAEEKGYFGVSAKKPDYTQANADVMNGGK